MKVKVTVAILILVLLVLAIPLLNLIISPNNEGLLPKRTDGVPQWDAVAAVLTKKCVHCHAPNAKMPFYAGFPIAKGMMQKDVNDGLTILDMPDEFYRMGEIPISEAAVAKMEFAVANDTMPPGSYLIMHWNHSLSAAEKNLVLDWVKACRQKYFVTPGVAKEFENLMIQPLPLSIQLDPNKVALGEKLDHDKRLSGDNTIACASCHDLKKGGTDQKQFSDGIKNQRGGINSPTVFNAGFQFIQFWDGRAADLFEQADGPVNNPIEMGSNWPEVISKLKDDPEIVNAITQLYPDGLTGNNIRDAIATYEKSLITPNSRLDKYLRGDKGALSDEEKKGFEVFTTKGCAMCHTGKVLGGQSFEKMGFYKDYFAERGNVGDADNGRFNVTKKELDRHKFKVPMLRNITLTFPYFHDGSTSDLKKVVEIMASHQLEDGLSGDEITAIVAFLQTLTGELAGQMLQ